MTFPEPARSGTTDLRFSQILQYLEGQARVLNVIQSTLAQVVTNDALSTQDRANTRIIVGELRAQQDVTKNQLVSVATDVSQVKDTVREHGQDISDHEGRLRDFDKLMTRVAVAVILAVILPVALFVLQKLLP